MTYKHSNFSEILVPKIWWWINVHRFSIYFSSKNIAKSWYLPHVQANSSGWDDPLSPPAGMVISAPAAMVTSPMPWPRWPVGVLSEDGIPTILSWKFMAIWFSTLLVVIFKGLAERKSRCSRANQFWDIGIASNCSSKSSRHRYSGRMVPAKMVKIM